MVKTLFYKILSLLFIAGAILFVLVSCTNKEDTDSINQKISIPKRSLSYCQFSELLEGSWVRKDSTVYSFGFPEPLNLIDSVKVMYDHMDSITVDHSELISLLQQASQQVGSLYINKMNPNGSMDLNGNSWFYEVLDSANGYYLKLTGPSELQTMKVDFQNQNQIKLLSEDGTTVFLTRKKNWMTAPHSN